MCSQDEDFKFCYSFWKILNQHYESTGPNLKNNSGSKSRFGICITDLFLVSNCSADLCVCLSILFLCSNSVILVLLKKFNLLHVFPISFHLLFCKTYFLYIINSSLIFGLFCLNGQRWSLFLKNIGKGRVHCPYTVLPFPSDHSSLGLHQAMLSSWYLMQTALVRFVTVLSRK